MQPPDNKSQSHEAAADIYDLWFERWKKWKIDRLETKFAPQNEGQIAQ